MKQTIHLSKNLLLKSNQLQLILKYVYKIWNLTITLNRTRFIYFRFCYLNFWKFFDRSQELSLAIIKLYYNDCIITVL